jgi:hypothetical protein
MTSLSHARRIARADGGWDRHRKNPDGAAPSTLQTRVVP